MYKVKRNAKTIMVVLEFIIDGQLYERVEGFDGMKNNLGSLNNYLFEQLERLNDDETLQQEETFDKEIKRSKAVIDTAKTIIDNAKIVLDAQKYQNEYGVKKDIPEMLQMGMK